MAVVEYGAMVTALRGSVGGWTFQQNASGAIVRRRPKRLKPHTQQQQQQIAQQVDWVRKWQDLTLSQQDAWNVYAAANTKVSRFGVTKNLTGFNWYQSINSNLVAAGQSEVSTPPTHVDPTAVPAYQVLLTDDDILIKFTATFLPGNTGLKVWATPPITGASSNQGGQLRRIGVETSAPYDVLTLTSAWEAQTGLTYTDIQSNACFKIAAMIEPVELTSGVAAEGLTGVGEYVDEDFRNFYSLQLTQSTSYITTTDARPTDFQVDDPFTIVMWVRITAVASGTVLRLASNKNGTGPGFRFNYIQSTGKIQISLTDNSAQSLIYRSDSSVSISGWIMLAAGKDGTPNASGASLWRNGSPVAASVVADNLTAMSDTQSGNITTFNANPDGSDIRADMDVAVVRIYDRKLSDSEISQQYASGVPQNPETGTVIRMLADDAEWDGSKFDIANPGGLGESQTVGAPQSAKVLESPNVD